MKELFAVIGIIGSIFTIIMFLTGTQSISEFSVEANFFITFFKTPIVYFVDVIALGLTPWTFIIDLVRYYFFDSSELWYLTGNMWQSVWNDLTIDWYWTSSKGWHIIISFIIWHLVIMIFGYQSENYVRKE